MRWLLDNGESDTPARTYRFFMLILNSILCGDIAIKSIEEPFISETDDQEEWAI